MRSAVYVKTLQKTPKGTIYTLAVVCPDIPGGIVSNSSKELDSSGRLIRRSTLELVDYNTEPEKSRTSLFGRNASRETGEIKLDETACGFAIRDNRAGQFIAQFAKVKSGSPGSRTWAALPQEVQ